MTTQPKTLAQFNQLKDAEDYFEFFAIPYDPTVVNVNRLHILRQFSKLVQSSDENQDEATQLDNYCQALGQAYEVFLHSSGVEQKLFKVFQDQHHDVVMLSDITVE